MKNDFLNAADVGTAVLCALLEAKAIFINTKEFFTYSSGIKSPIYCDNRVLISHVKIRDFIAEKLAENIAKNAPECELIAATATGAIAHGAYVSQKMSLPLCYILSKPKTHGRGKQIEGAFSPGQEAVIIEDLISSGGSALAALKAAREHGLKASKVFSIFSYELDAAKRAFEAEGAELFSLSGFSAFKNKLSANELEILNNWRNNQ